MNRLKSKTEPFKSKPNLSKPNLSKPNLPKANSNLSKPNLSKPNLSKPNLSKPNLSKPNLSKPNLPKANSNLSKPNQNLPKPKQLTLATTSQEFEDYWKKSGRRVHGGIYARGKRKTKRPFDSNKPVHLVMRSEKARGALSLNSATNERPVDHIVKKFAAKFGIRIYSYSNNGNHIHLQIRAKHRRDFQSYLRTISGLIARLILKARKGKAKGKFWDTLAFTRVSEWGKAFAALKDYVIKNVLESAGVIPYTPRRFKLIEPYNSA